MGTTDVKQQPYEEHNAKRFIWANGLQGIGDQIVAPKTVLPWLFSAAGVPGFFTALLVPIREAGSMLPQAAWTPWVTTQRSRKRVWIIGSIGQFIAASLIAVAAAFLDGIALGIAVIALLSVLAVFRALCSIASKDVQGRTISKGRRGRITGRATALSGAITLAVGFGLTLLPTEIPRWILVSLIAGGALTWGLGTIVFQGIKEPSSEDEPQPMKKGWWADTWGLFTRDKEFRQFVIARSLLLVTALSTTFIVTLSQEIGQDITGLGIFVIASGLASLVGGRISGVFSDASSKSTMAVSSAVASAVIVALVISANLAPASVNAWVMPAGFFLVTLAHTGVRVARKTYLVDMAEGDLRTRYTGAANTLMGVILLLVGALSGLVAQLGSQAALIFLAVIGVAGVIQSSRLRDVSANRENNTN
ncbi:MFS transporter [Corynebacterium breve]|uniref:MFS transporter n=1 Tax=Corynebacterium breve TaxID=3049799 RepID=A0ABY8VG67_9CORY|nr:MFS transporter [Corynebacterium breve]WIM68489.1 MFS transporter [Corynebacterium breve]